jgi:hypothetical protein
MGTLGFSFVGLVYLILMFAPNILWMRAVKEPPKETVKEPPVLVWMERIGQVAIVVCALFFRDYDRIMLSPRLMLLAGAFVLLILYDLWWVRCFRNGLREEDLYSSFLGIPIAGAILPVAGLLLLGLFGGVIWMILASVVLGAGHIPISYLHWKNLKQ